MIRRRAVIVATCVVFAGSPILSAKGSGSKGSNGSSTSAATEPRPFFSHLFTKTQP